MGFDFLEEARRLIGMNSVSAKGTADIAHHVGELASAAGLQVQLQDSPQRGVRQVTVIAEKGPETRADLLLNTHLDTVPPGNLADWTACEGDPFQAVVDGDRIYGLGSADTKLDILCKLKALESFGKTPFKNRVALVGTHGEEIGLRGAQALVDSGFFNFAYALVGEPSNLRPIFAHKGLSVWEVKVDPTGSEPPIKENVEMIELVFQGKRAHASTPALGRNAVLAALDFIAGAARKGLPVRVFGISGGTASNVVPDRCSVLLARDPAIEEEACRTGVAVDKKGVCAGRMVDCVEIVSSVLEGLQALQAQFEEHKDDAFNPPTTTLNVGMIEIREGSLRLDFELRPIPDLSMEEVSESVVELDARLSARFPAALIQIENLRANPPMQDARKGVLLGTAVEVLAEIGCPAEVGSKATCTEAAVYSQIGIDTIVFGPGVSEGNVHRPNEHNLLSQCEKAIAFYTRMIERLCI